MPRFALQGNCLVSMTIATPLGTTQTFLDDLSRGIVELLKQCVKVHQVGGNLKVGGIDITVERKQRALRGLPRYNRPAAVPVSSGISGVSSTDINPTVAPQQTPAVSPVRSASPPASQFLFGAPPAEIEPAVREALKLALHRALGDPGVRPALPQAFEHARRIPSDGLTREQALHVAFRQVPTAPAAPPIVQQTLNAFRHLLLYPSAVQQNSPAPTRKGGPQASSSTTENMPGRPPPKARRKLEFKV